VVGSTDYGREIELPSEIPPPRAPRETVSIAARAAVEHPIVQEPVPVAARPAPEPVRAATVAQPVPHPVARQPVAEPRRMQPVPEAMPAPAPAPRSAAQTAPTNVVVPVKLPADGTPGEIVIRIVFERQD
jgi:hypothetical protein